MNISVIFLLMVVVMSMAIVIRSHIKEANNKYSKYEWKLAIQRKPKDKMAIQNSTGIKKILIWLKIVLKESIDMPYLENIAKYRKQKRGS